MREDLAHLNLNFLAVARELARSRPEEALTRMGLDREACTLLAGMSLQDIEQLARSAALVFRLAQSPGQLAASLRLARRDPLLSEVHLLLSAGPA